MGDPSLALDSVTMVGVNLYIYIYIHTYIYVCIYIYTDIYIYNICIALV